MSATFKDGPTRDPRRAIRRLTSPSSWLGVLIGGVGGWAATT